MTSVSRSSRGQIQTTKPPPLERIFIKDNDRDLRVAFGSVGGTLCGAEPFRPVLVLGPQRSRKTTGVVVPTLRDWRGPAVVTSVRDDVIEQSRERRSSLGKIYVFDPGGAVPHTTPDLAGWSPLDACRTWDQAVWMANAFTNAARAGGVSMEAFWYQKASQLLASLFHAAAVGERGMGDVLRWVKTEDESEARRILDNAGASEAADLADHIWRLVKETRHGVLATASQVMAVYDHDGVLDREVRGGFSLDEFFDGQSNTLYICAPPDEQEEFAPLLTTLIEQIFRRAYRHNRDFIPGLDGRGIPGREGRRLLVLLDEAGNITRLRRLRTLATTAAGSGIQLVTVFHDLSQMIEIYGADAARSLANNHSALMILPGNREPVTSELVGAMIANQQVAGWDTHDTGSAGSSLRRLEPGTALCLYENLDPFIVKLRSSVTDEGLAKMWASPIK